MARTLTALSVNRITGVRFECDVDNIVSRINVTGEVNYGKFGKDETIDVLPLLKASEKQWAQKLFEAIKIAFEKASLE